MMDNIINLSKAYTFEGESIATVDLSGLDSLTAEDMIAAEKYAARAGVISPIPEMTVEYICHIASRVTGKPLEFFKALSPRDVIKVKNAITSFFYAGD